MKIKFDHFKCLPGRIEFDCQDEKNGCTEPERIFFELDQEVLPENDAIACLIATLCGDAYDDIVLDLSVAKDLIAKIQKFTKAVVHAKESDDPCEKSMSAADREKGKVILNFSGGGDSLAAKCLLPSDIELVSIDFGTGFERERNFFEQFHPHILRTNFRRLKMDRNSWTFMGAGAILYSKYLRASHYVFGTVLEATTWNFLPHLNRIGSGKVPPFSFMGLESIRCITGLTEVGTTMVVCHYLPQLMDACLSSLSRPGTIKRKRKELLFEIVCSRYGRKANFVSTPAPERKIPFGQNFLEDFLCLYYLKHRGREAAQNIISDIPEEALLLAGRLKLNFYERLHCAFLNESSFPDNQWRADYIKKAVAAGVLPYEEEDYREIRLVADFLNQYHNYYPSGMA